MRHLSLNRRLAVDFLVDFIREEAGKFGFRRVVLGLSGGVDSALACALAVRALGADGVLPIAMPHRDSVPESAADAELVAHHLGVTLRTVGITGAADALIEGLAVADKVGIGNIKSRVRMIVLYELSRAENALVLGTSNKSELLLGYGTMHADMASGLNPLGDLYKTQIFGLAEELQLPERVRSKPPSADLWKGQTDEAELGFRYAEVDRVLVRMVDRRASDRQIVEDGFPADFVAQVRAMVRAAQYKRMPPVLAKVGLRTVGIDFLYHRDWGH